MSNDLNLDSLKPGPIALFGSGETSPSGRKTFEYLFRSLSPSPRVALLETPAGFELNSDKVIGRIGEFLEHRLQNFDPHIQIIPARKRGTYHSPDNPDILCPMENAELIFMGPGSPTYAINQLRDSLAWQMLIANHALGGAIALASAAAIAVSKYALPVYEIYKVGEDLHWKAGLDLFRLYGLPVVIVSHWNNNDGGDELDTRHCFMGIKRMASLMNMLPKDITIIGIDELTTLIIEPAAGECRVLGKGYVNILYSGNPEISRTHPPDLDSVSQYLLTSVHKYHEGETFPISKIGPIHPLTPQEAIPQHVWSQVLNAKQKNPDVEADVDVPTNNIIKLTEEREKARFVKDWQKADKLRDEIADLGWEIKDTPKGPQLNRIKR